jgi:hypothetical protein
MQMVMEEQQQQLKVMTVDLALPAYMVAVVVAVLQL